MSDATAGGPSTVLLDRVGGGAGRDARRGTVCGGLGGHGYLG